MLSDRLLSAKGGGASNPPPPLRRQNRRSCPPSRRTWDLAGTTLFLGAVSSRLQLHPFPTPLLAQSLKVLGMKKGKTAKSAPRVTVGSKQAPVTKSNKPAKPRQPSQPKPKELVALTQPNQSSIEISDLDNLPLNACVELTRRLLTSVPTLTSGQARSRAVLKIVILFVDEYGSTA